jgi:hypothetical protein
MLETDFGTVQDMASTVDWVRQEYNVSAEDGRGEHGKAFRSTNVEPRLESSVEGDGGAGDVGKAVLQLKVGASLGDGAVPAAEVDSARLDLHWGSFRTGMKVTSTNGTCAAFFWVSSAVPLAGLRQTSGRRLLECLVYEDIHTYIHAWTLLTFAAHSISTIPKRLTWSFYPVSSSQNWASTPSA